MHNVPTLTKWYSTDDAVGDFPQGDSVHHHDSDSMAVPEVAS